MNTTRPIKFRQPTLWKANKFHSWHYWGFYERGYTGPLCIDLPSFQYTGNQDSKGREIYEGDVIEIDPHDLDCSDKGLVYHDERASAFRVSFADGNIWWLYEIDFAIAEVIGNIYEHPELLESK